MPPTGNENVNAALAAVDQATTALGARVQALIDEINRTAGDGLTGPQTEAVLARLAGFIPTLNGLGNMPTPPPVPDPVPLPAPFRA